MFIIIRGHIRNSFENNKLYDLVKNIYENESNIKIYIHTWSVFANNISWRYIEENNCLVTKELIYSYFNDLGHLIEDIIIDDDTNIELIGNLNGNIGSSNMPLIGWKNYWYGKYKIVKHIYDKDTNLHDLVVNFRFDILENSNPLLFSDIVNFIQNNKETSHIKKNTFLNDYEFNGLDNIYIGNIYTMYKLTHLFHYHLEDILAQENIYHQEYLVFKVNKIIFSPFF
jgi:hypothetical protein